MHKTMQHHWVFSLASELTETDSLAFDRQVADFLANWKAHGTPVPARHELRHRRFLLVEALDMPSGCSVDSLRKGLEALAQAHHTHFAEASLVFAEVQGEIQPVHFQDVPRLLQLGLLSPQSRVFDQTVVQRGSFDGFEARLCDTWLNRYLAAV